MSPTNVCAVLGVGPGLGAAVARRFARGGYAVAMLSRSPDKIADVERQIAAAGGRAKRFGADATRADSVSAALSAVAERGESETRGAGAAGRVVEEAGDGPVRVLHAGSYLITILQPDSRQAPRQAGEFPGLAAFEQIRLQRPRGGRTS